MKRDNQITELEKRIESLLEQIIELKKDVAHEIYEHYVTCESEGLNWDSPIPEKPEGY